MDYRQAIDYILRFADYERLPRSGVVWDLARIEKLLERLGNPQHAARSIHVAGTKGKGSTAAMISSILVRAGYRTGLFTSPHLLSFTERIQADGRPISEEAWARLTGILEPEIEAVNRSAGLGELTTFEILTALAFTRFREIKADYQVMEVGLGGRLDATNVIRPDVCVITSISYDHTDLLGKTLDRIAAEKAGIIKDGSDVVCAPQFPEAMKAIEETCRERGARLIRAGSDVTWKETGFNTEGQSFRLKGLTHEYNLKIPLLGEHQIENAAVAVTAAEVLAGKGADISPRAIEEGLESVNWPGRLQVLRKQPWVVADSAHNAYSIKRLGEALKRHFPAGRTILVLGASSDKDIGGIAAEASALADEVIIAVSRNPRALQPQVLLKEFAERGKEARAGGDISSAMRMAMETAAPGDLICAAGSVFIVAEVLEYMAGT